MKKILLIVPLFVILFGIYNIVTKQEDIPYTYKLDEPTEILFWYVADEEITNFIDELTSEFNDEFEMINVQTENFPTIEDYTSKIESSDIKPNLVMLDPYWLYELSNNEELLDLTPYFQNQLIDINYDTFLSNFIHEVSIENNIIAIPFFKYSDIIYINNDTFDYNEEQPLYNQITEDSNISIENQANLFGDLISSCGFINWVDVNNKIAFNDPCVAKGLKNAQDLYKNGQLITNDSQSLDSFLSGDIDIYIGSSLHYNQISGSVENLQMIPVSNISSGQFGYDIGIMKTESSNDNLASLMYIDYITSTDNSQKLSDQFGTIPVRLENYNEIANELNELFYLQKNSLNKIIPNYSGAYYIYNAQFDEFLNKIFNDGAKVQEELDKFTEDVQNTFDMYN